MLSWIMVDIEKDKKGVYMTSKNVEKVDEENKKLLDEFIEHECAKAPVGLDGTVEEYIREQYGFWIDAIKYFKKHFEQLKDEEFQRREVNDKELEKVIVAVLDRMWQHGNDIINKLKAELEEANADRYKMTGIIMEADAEIKKLKEQKYNIDWDDGFQCGYNKLLDGVEKFKIGYVRHFYDMDRISIETGDIFIPKKKFQKLKKETRK